MPKLTGLETIRLLKQFKALLPCILMSAQLDDFLVEEALRAQAYSVLAKPITFRQITGVVRQALERTYDWRRRDGDLPLGPGVDSR
jgi:DNA-binding NtrC family response regulator